MASRLKAVADDRLHDESVLKMTDAVASLRLPSVNAWNKKKQYIIHYDQ